VRGRRQTWRSEYWCLLEEAELPHDPVDGVLLDVDYVKLNIPKLTKLNFYTKLIN
jgi:hypothetical protein